LYLQLGARKRKIRRRMIERLDNADVSQTYISIIQGWQQSLSIVKSLGFTTQSFAPTSWRRQYRRQLKRRVARESAIAARLDEKGASTADTLGGRQSMAIVSEPGFAMLSSAPAMTGIRFRSSTPTGRRSRHRNFRGAPKKRADPAAVFFLKALLKRSAAARRF
jgi:hypothetical protein